MGRENVRKKIGELGIQSHFKNTYLRKIAFMNLKKEAGEASVNSRTIRDYYKEIENILDNR